MYKNLKAEMAKKDINIEKLSNSLGISYETMRLKLKGDSVITLLEAKQIKEIIGSEMNLEILFSVEEGAED